MIEDNQIEINTRNDSKLSRYSSNNLKKSLDLAKKISNQNLPLDAENHDNSSKFITIEQSGRGKRAFDMYSRLLRDRNKCLSLLLLKWVKILILLVPKLSTGEVSR